MMMLRELSETKTALRAQAYLHTNAHVILGCISLSGITLMLARMEPWKLYLLACLGLVFLPVFLHQGAMGLHQVRAQSTVASEVLPEHHEPTKKETATPDLHVTVAKQPEVHMPVIVAPRLLSPSVSLKEDPIMMTLPPLVLDTTFSRKGLHIMSKDVLHEREQLFARAMTSLRSLSPRNKPVVHHVDLIKYAEEIDDQNEDAFL
ncbi:hypothetical protein SDRG_08900 [Saprolegnia diclina VS20]|uniref:Uncharacterized protein n=1 Tax=Saprolegnia diclina (strain VS20) TaxID=1156394 RepID=T0RLY7_SAPDV|nr:hypothetical protein SDRG_08900 [Saprolegnia diclina VS20]EQC33383.1 hypothetical protein SDRG_08900 [Saprolegnia diclina VS20]|eukprot:XP_008613023.1 hypothetical protein SDRG_08900 [Saprolegnia diclina VS20]